MLLGQPQQRWLQRSSCLTTQKLSSDVRTCMVPCGRWLGSGGCRSAASCCTPPHREGSCRHSSDACSKKLAHTVGCASTASTVHCSQACRMALKIVGVHGTLAERCARCKLRFCVLCLVNISQIAVPVCASAFAMPLVRFKRRG